MNGIVYISSANEHFSYSGKLSEIGEIFKEAEVICYDGKALYHKLKREGCDPTSIRFIDLLLYSYVLNPGGGSPTAESLATTFIGKTPEVGCPVESMFSDIEKAMNAKIREIGAEKILNEIELDASLESVAVPVTRARAGKDLTVNLVAVLPAGITVSGQATAVGEADEKGNTTYNTSVTFKAGEAQADLILDISQMAVGASYSGTVSLAEGVKVNENKVIPTTTFKNQVVLPASNLSSSVSYPRSWKKRTM